ncbi:type II toxin-antitoxin system Rv0910 family toxin [Nocardia beijingensis]|uniref:type II toxin-antitoxin system Rv0910 family toxin n=1 Tax=Nocardia beijingensis TaxID=95162 RepID=UPI0033EDC5B1
MRTVEVNARYGARPEEVWAILCDLPRWSEWLAIHKAWKSDVPNPVTRGVVVTAAAVVMNMPISIDWTVEDVAEPHSLVMGGTTRAGVKLALAVDLRAESGGTTVAMAANIEGGMIDGPMGGVFKRSLVGALDKSLKKAEALLA